MEKNKLYDDIAKRTQGNIYIGVVGPVRTGKSTFIKRFMETIVIPEIDNVYRRERARDELPQSGSGKTIMTAEPKFVPEEAVSISIAGGGEFSVRLIDSVGYMVPGAIGQEEDGRERMVTTPWFNYEIPMTKAAEIGTKKVIEEHSTIGIVITTDGSITELPRENYISAENTVIQELKALSKPFIVLLNCTEPKSVRSQEIALDISKRHHVSVMPVNCMALGAGEIEDIIRSVLYEFPISEMVFKFPDWVKALPTSSPIKTELLGKILACAPMLRCMRDAGPAVSTVMALETVNRAELKSMDLGSGKAVAELDLPRSLFYRTVSDSSGFEVKNDGDLVRLLVSLSDVKSGYDRIAGALKQVRDTGYGVIMPSRDEMVLEEPEVIKQGGRYGVRLRANASAIHLISADIKSEISPTVGSQQQSEDLINYLLAEVDGDKGRLWESNIFGKSLFELVNEELGAKICRMPADVKEKFRHAIQKVVNDGSGTVICIIF